MSDRKRKHIASRMEAKLPYTLTKGVTATREGLQFDIYDSYVTAAIYFSLSGTIPIGDSPRFLTWPNAAERLRYREGEPWCYVHNQTDTGEDVIELASHPGCRELFPTLHRLAVILCDDAEGFRVLHWCVKEFGDE